MSIESKTTLSAQQRGQELEHRVVSVNKAGDGKPDSADMTFCEIESNN